MKYLKYVALIILLLLIGFILLGVMTPSVSYDCEVIVNKGMNEAWSVMSDETKLDQWIDGYKRNELVSGTPNTVGAVTNVYVEDNGSEMMMTETILQIAPPVNLKMAFSMDMMNMDYEIHLTELGNTTAITTSSKTIGNGMIWKSMVALMPKAMKAQENENLQNLKKIIEENTKNYGTLADTNPNLEIQD